MLLQGSSLRSLQSLIQICAHIQVWQLDEGSLLNDPNVIYTFDFFHPWSYISNETGAVRSVFIHIISPRKTPLNSINRWGMEQFTPVTIPATMSSKDG